MLSIPALVGPVLVEGKMPSIWKARRPRTRMTRRPCATGATGGDGVRRGGGGVFGIVCK